MSLELIVGPPNSGRAGAILDRFTSEQDLDPILVVPTRDDVDRFERELCGRPGGLLGGTDTAIFGADAFDLGSADAARGTRQLIAQAVEQSADLTSQMVDIEEAAASAARKLTRGLSEGSERTDAEGECSLIGLPRSTRMLRVLAAGFVEATRVVELGDQELVERVTLSRGAILHGLVRHSDGTPVQAARVHVAGSIREKRSGAPTTHRPGRSALASTTAPSPASTPSSSASWWKRSWFE